MGTSLKGLRVKCQLKVAQKARKNEYTYYLIGMLFVYLCIIHLFILPDNLPSEADTRKAKQGHSFSGTFS